MTGHPDPDVLAEFPEGLLGWRRTRRIRAHLAGCTRCAAVVQEIAEVSTLLASAPAPRMPDALAGRLEAVLAAESAARTAQAHGQEIAQAAGSAAPAAPGVRPDRVTRPRRPAGRRVTARRAAAIAASVVVIAVGGYGLTKVQIGPAGPSGGRGIAGPAHNSLAAPGATRGIGPAMGSAGSPGILPLIRSGTDYQPGQLVAQVGHELRRHSTKESPLAGESAPLPQDQTLTGCVFTITRGVPPQLVDAARYRGRPATIIVVAATDGQPGQVWVAGSNCSAGRPDVITHTQLTGTG